MIKNYIKTAWRSLLRNKAFSLINIVGLAIGIAVFVFIMQYVAFEWGANRFHKNYDQLSRVSLVDKDGKNEIFIPPGFAPVFKAAFPVIADYVRIGDELGGAVVNVPDKGNAEQAYREEKIVYADPDFFKVFTFPLLSGNASLSEPQTVALSASTAKKYFGSADAVGKVIKVNNQFGHTPYTVTAVYQDMPDQSDIDEDILLSFKSLDDAALRDGNDWADPKNQKSGFVKTYILVKDNTALATLSRQVSAMMHTLQPDTKTDAMVLQPMRDMHLAPTYSYNLQTFGSLMLVTLFVAVALLILVIAWVNYINLSIAQSLNRAREIGVRKVLGAARKQLISQFLAETFIVTLTGVGLALLLVYILQPVYNGFLGKNLSLSILNQSWIWAIGGGLIVFGSLFSGGYVALVLSSFNPIKAIGGKAESLTKGISLRKGLVVFQFTVSVVFIIATLVLYQQLKFMKTENLGMQVDQRLVIAGPEMNGGKLRSQAFKNQLGALSFVQKYAASNDIPGKGYNFSAAGITRLNPNPGDEKKNFAMLNVDDRYFDTYGIKITDGRAFSYEDAQTGYAKAARVMINQQAAAQLGFKPGQNVVGQKINWDNKTYEIVGLVHDYHHLSLREAIRPMVFLPSVASAYYTIKLSADHMQDKVNTLKKMYQAQFPGNPFDYFFLDENYDQQYKTEQKLGGLFITAASVAVFIACMGLFGLASFVAQQRTKEIGIRKVLGASVSHIIRLVSGDFLKLVAVAIVIASPIAWYAMNSWLQDFAYRITIPWWMIGVAGLIAVFIAFATVSFQSVKAAVANPVKSLRSE